MNSNPERQTVMKKIYITLAVLATAALSSCVQEKSFEGYIVGENEVAFVLRAGASTKAAGSENPVRNGISTKIGVVENFSVYLEETITDLSCIAPATKGTPVYTENVGSLYKDNLFVHAAGFGEATYETLDDAQMENSGWRYFHRYDTDWPNDGGDVNFHLVMPADAINSSSGEGTPEGMSGLTYNSSKPATTFTYLSPVTAADQSDIIVSGIKLNKAQHNSYLPAGAPVTFYHALTAVKFAIGNTAQELSSKGIAITGVTFTGLLNSGTCTVDPTATGDNPIVTWNDLSAADDNVISQTFTAAENVINFDKATDSNNFADSFYEAGNSQNVNTADASYTFWLIPQFFPSTSNAVLRISYTINNHNEYLDITLKDIIKKPNGTPIKWEAGQLRTFTIKLDEVNVKITDEVSISGTADNAYSGSTKSNVRIQNTGDTDAFIRAAIVGQWIDKDGNPVFGFTDTVNNLYIVESWYEDQFGANPSYSHGLFTGLPGYNGASTFKADSGSDATAGWQLCTDGYYYYTKIVEPGHYTGSNLFSTYTTSITPAVIIAGVVMDQSEMHFELEISTQAITAVKMDGHEGSRYTWKQAWANATGETPVEK